MEVKEAYIPPSASSNFSVKLFNVHVPPGKREFRLHKHTFFELVLFKSGSGTYTTLNKAYSIKAGDVFIFSSNEVHCITEIDKYCEMVLMNIHIDPHYLWSLDNESFSPQYINLCFSHNPDFENRLDRDSSYLDGLRSLFLSTEEEFYKQNKEYTLMVRTKLMQLLISLIRNFDYADASSHVNVSLHMEAVKASMNYIHHHVTDPITLKEISKEAKMSPTYFCAVFKDINGISIWEYVTDKRIEMAMHLLKEPDNQTILSIALQCGFNNTANFNKMFKKNTGRTPSEYRKSEDAFLY